MPLITLRQLIEATAVFVFFLTAATLVEIFLHPWIILPSALLTGLTLIAAAVRSKS